MRGADEGVFTKPIPADGARQRLIIRALDMQIVALHRGQEATHFVRRDSNAQHVSRIVLGKTDSGPE